MASSWQGSHYIVVLGAAGLAFVAGYAMGGRQPRPTEVVIGNNTTAPVFPGIEANQADAPPPPVRPGRMDENELIAANREPEDGQQQQPPATRQPPRDRGTQDQGRGSRDDQGDQQPPEEDYQQEEQDPYGE